MGLFSQTVERGLGFVRESSKTEMIPTVDAQLINSLCSTFVSLLADAKLDLAAENYLEPAKEAVAAPPEVVQRLLLQLLRVAGGCLERTRPSRLPTRDSC